MFETKQYPHLAHWTLIRILNGKTNMSPFETKHNLTKKHRTWPLTIG